LGPIDVATDSLATDQDRAQGRNAVGALFPIPEVIFDQGIGDLFDCRVAGTVIDTPVTGSIEYAIDHFHTPLIVVLGHENCGAVKTALAALDPGGSLPEASIGGLVRELIPNVRGD
jgi:carbonic anhydrase